NHLLVQLKLWTKYLNFSSNLVQTTTNWNSQLCTLQLSMEHHHFLMTQLTKNTQWHQSLIPSSTISQHLWITQMSPFNSKCHFLTTMTSLDVLVSVVSSAVQLKWVTK